MKLPRPNIRLPEFRRPGLKLPKLDLRGRGPQLRRGPQIKAPQPVVDLYADLRDRHLLPVVAVLVLAMIAVPFVFGDSSDSGEAPVAAAAPPPVDTGPAALTVSAAPDPGLRDYRRRFGGEEKNPFVQQYPPEASGSGSDSGDGDGDSTGGDTAEVSVSETGDGTVEVDVSPSGGGSSDGGAGELPPGVRFFGFRPDIRFGKAGSGKLALHKELPIGTVLPKRQGVALFLGVTENGNRALFSISPRVVMVKGAGSCIGGKKRCEVLSLKKGQAATLVGAAPLPVYRLAIVDIELVEVEEKSKQAKAGSSSIRESLGSVQRVRRFSK